jgi:surfeit locus 1 family protein
VNEALPARPARAGLVGPALVVMAMLAVLLALGTWQLERKAWKENLIDTLERRLAAPAGALPPRGQWGALDQQSDEFRRVAFRAELLPAREGRVYSNGTALRDDITGPGYFVFTPARLADGSSIVINRGYVADPNPGPSSRPIGRSEGPIDIVGVLRWPEAGGPFVSDYTPSDNLWFIRDPRAMAARYRWGDVAPFYVEQEAPLPPGGVPAPGKLRINLRNEHLQYAITWYGLAAALMVIFLIRVRARGRAV